MDLRFFCIVLGSVVTARNVKNDLGEHLQRLVRSDDVDGYFLATLHALDTATCQLTGQSKRDIEAYSSDLTSDKSDFSLHLSSGERLRMTLKRRSIDTSAAAVTELKDGKRETIRLQARDCFFAGPLEGEQGFAALSMCDGRLMGSVTTAKRAYELYALPDVTDKRSSDDVMKVLVTWEDTSYALKRQTDGEYYGNDGIEIPEEVLESDSAEDEEDEQD